MRTLLFVGGLAIGAVTASAALLLAGFYNVGATSPHLAPVYRVLEKVLRESVKHHADAISVPPLTDAGLIQHGLAQYREHCVQCHGAPGVAPAPFALGMVPVPANLVHTARAWGAEELYWTVKHGIRMSGMPAWQVRLTERDIWAIVAFLRELPALTPQEYQARAAAAKHVATDAAPPAQPSVARGKLAIAQYACHTCHQIPGIVGPNAPVGPPLEAIATRKYLAGMLPNTTENMIRWLRDPQSINPRSAMPDLGVGEHDARDIAAYLYTLK